MLAQLAPHYYRADFGPAQAEALFEAFCDDLSEFEIADIRGAVTAYRRDPKNRFFPSTAQLRALAASEAKDRMERARFENIRLNRDRNSVLRRPQFWWLLPHWNAEWSYDEIPYEYRAAFDRHMKCEGKPKTYRIEAERTP
jgi:hypothetical protein